MGGGYDSVKKVCFHLLRKVDEQSVLRMSIGSEFQTLGTAIVNWKTVRLRVRISRSETDLVLLLICFLPVLVGATSSKQPKALSFQIGSGRNLAGMFFT